MGQKLTYEFREDGALTELVVPPLLHLNPALIPQFFPKDIYEKMEKKYHALLKVSGTKEGVDLAAFMDHWFEEEPAKKKVKLPASLAQNMFEALDPNGTGFFDWNSFQVAMTVLLADEAEDTLDFVFHVLSGHGSTVSRNVLESLLQALIQVTYQLLEFKPTYLLEDRVKAVVDDCFDKFVIDESHGLTYAEYQEWIGDHLELGDFMQFLFYRGFDPKHSPKDVPKLAEPPVPPKLDTASDVLTDQVLLDLQRDLPSTETNCDLKLLYSSARDGYSLFTLYNKCKSHMGPVLLVIKTAKGESLGAYLSQSLREASASYFGDESCFVFKVTPQLKTFLDHQNTNFIKCQNDSIIIGGPDPAISIDRDLDNGTSKANTTYQSPALVKGENFKITRVEIWRFVKRESAEKSAPVASPNAQQKGQDANVRATGSSIRTENKKPSGGATPPVEGGDRSSGLWKQSHFSKLARASRGDINEVTQQKHELEVEVLRLKSELKEIKRKSQMLEQVETKKSPNAVRKVHMADTSSQNHTTAPSPPKTRVSFIAEDEKKPKRKSH